MVLGWVNDFGDGLMVLRMGEWFVTLSGQFLRMAGWL